MPSKKLPADNHILRFASATRLQFDDEGNVIALLPQAFRLRENEQNLSVTWIEYYSGSRQGQIEQAVQAFRRSMNNPPRSSSAFGMAEVGVVEQTCLRHKRPANVRILHNPMDSNPAHAAIHRYPPNDEELMELLASEAFCEIVLNKSVPQA